MSQIETYDCFIIGGGITGLSAAYYLQSKSKKIALAEAATFSGEIKTKHQQGFTLECGPNVIALKPELLSLLKDLGIEDELIYPAIAKYKQMVFADGKAKSVPKGILAFITSDLFSWSEKIQIAQGVFRKNLLDNNLNITIDNLFSRIFGSSIVQRVIDPVLLGIFGGRVNYLSAKSIFPALYKRMAEGASFFSAIRSGTKRPKIAVIKSGMQKITEKILENIHDKVILISQEVVNLRKTDGLYEITFKSGAKCLSKNIFIATSGKSTAGYISGISSDLSKKLNDFQAASLSIVHAAVKTLPASFQKSFGVLFPSSLSTPLLGVMFNSRLFPHLSPKENELLTLCFGGMHNPDFYLKEETEVFELAIRELKDKLQIQDIEILNFQVWKNAIPQYEASHEDILRTFVALEAENKGLFFCGADKGGIGVPDRVAAAKAALVDFISQQ